MGKLRVSCAMAAATNPRERVSVAPRTTSRSVAFRGVGGVSRSSPMFRGHTMDDS